MPIRARGRPRATASQRTALLQAARHMATVAPNQELNLRQIALRAGVTPALAHYYFKNRDGLLAALIDELAAPQIEALVQSVQAQSGGPAAALTSLMQRLSALLARDRFLAHCLLMQAAASVRARLKARLQTLLAQGQLGGALRSDLPADYLAETLLGLAVFPLLDAEVSVEPAEWAAALTLQHVALLQGGIRVQRPRQDSGS